MLLEIRTSGEGGVVVVAGTFVASFVVGVVCIFVGNIGTFVECFIVEGVGTFVIDVVGIVVAENVGPVNTLKCI